MRNAFLNMTCLHYVTSDMSAQVLAVLLTPRGSVRGRGIRHSDSWLFHLRPGHSRGRKKQRSQAYHVLKKYG